MPTFPIIPTWELDVGAAVFFFLVLTEGEVVIVPVPVCNTAQYSGPASPISTGKAKDRFGDAKNTQMRMLAAKTILPCFPSIVSLSQADGSVPMLTSVLRLGQA